MQGQEDISTEMTEDLPLRNSAENNTDKIITSQWAKTTMHKIAYGHTEKEAGISAEEMAGAEVVREASLSLALESE